MLTFDFVTKYYGVDLLAMGITFLGIYKIGNKNRSGFLLTLIGNVLWIIFAIFAHTLGVILANIVLIILNVRNFIKWGKPI